jgi:transposase
VVLDPPQPELLPFETDAIGINARCLLKTQDGHRVVLVAGVPIVHYAFGDAMTEAYAMVQLVAQWADQNEVARGFDRSERSVRCYQRRFEGGGLAALARPGGYPAGRPRVARSRDRRVNQLRAEGKSLRQIAEAVGVSEKRSASNFAGLVGQWPSRRRSNCRSRARHRRQSHRALTRLRSPTKSHKFFLRIREIPCNGS